MESLRFITLVKDSLKSIVIAFGILSLFLSSSLLWEYLEGYTLTFNPSTWLMACFHFFHNNAQQRVHLLALLIALVLPVSLMASLMIAKKMHDECNANAYVYLFIGWGCMLVWLVVSSCIYQSMQLHRLTLASPFIYLHAFIAQEKYIFSSGFLGTFVIIAGFLLSHREKITHYGDARFATRSEIKKAGLFANDGIVLGKGYGKLLILGGYEHVTLFAPTGTGKTTGVTIPTLLYWQGSCVVSDIKLTLFEHTSAYRAKQQDVYLWNPGSIEGKTHCYNPLDLIKNTLSRIDDIQKIASIFIPDNPRTEPIWIVHSRALFVALILYALDTPDVECTISAVIQLVKTSPDFHGWVLDQIETRSDLDPLCIQNFMKFAELHEKTRLSILATFQAYFELFDNPMVVHATSKSDFNITELRRKKMTIYVGVTNDNLVRLSPLLTVFYQQVADVMTRALPQSNEPHGVLFLMDEFSTLRRMDSFHKNIGLYREYHLRVVIIIQELSQLYDIYGRDGAKVFINAKIRMAFTQNDEETCQMLSNACGMTTHRVKQRSQKLYGGILDNTASEAEHYIAKPLLLPQDIRRLSTHKALILVQGYPPILAQKLAWFREKLFKERMQGAISLLLSFKAVAAKENQIELKKRRVILGKEPQLMQNFANSIEDLSCDE